MIVGRELNQNGLPTAVDTTEEFIGSRQITVDRLKLSIPSVAKTFEITNKMNQGQKCCQLLNNLKVMFFNN
jgi:hypothetical protein